MIVVVIAIVLISIRFGSCQTCHPRAETNNELTEAHTYSRNERDRVLEHTTLNATAPVEKRKSHVFYPSRSWLEPFAQTFH